MNTLIKISSALSAVSDTTADPLGLVQHQGRNAQRQHVAERRIRRRDRVRRG